VKTKAIKVGDPENYENFVNAVIHEEAFDRLARVIEKAQSDPTLELLAGGKASKEEGYFVQPTIYQTMDPQHELMKRELFGPIALVYVFPDAEWLQMLKTIDTTTSYGLTGSVFARD
jgi:1-pyrroline-5-carboxylate dehydrogenase